MLYEAITELVAKVAAADERIVALTDDVEALTEENTKLHKALQGHPASEPGAARQAYENASGSGQDPMSERYFWCEDGFICDSTKPSGESTTDGPLYEEVEPVEELNKLAEELRLREWEAAIGRIWQLDGVGPKTLQACIDSMSDLIMQEAERAEQAESEVERLNEQVASMADHAGEV